MLLHVPDVLSKTQLRYCRQNLAQAEWVDGRATAGTQSSLVKNNLQLAEGSPKAAVLQQLVLDALLRHALFYTAALPKKIFPPLFNCYTGNNNAFGNHIDNSMRTHVATGYRVRSDLSATLFISDPDEYEGGELVIEDTFGGQRVKLPGGHLILYPSSSIHRVEPVTKGTRIASFMWLESMVRDEAQRRLLFEMDMAIMELRNKDGENSTSVKLTGCYHNLLRMWADS
ncbi:MAG TPA: Fe2+-dependent dioxygenase [Pseudomonadales bacterium]|nr:Fe2+-dependent dioxygenase [Pseudomonadales bacterium]